MTVATLPRVFIHKDNGQEIRLADPSEKLGVDAVLNFYINTYPILTNAHVSPPTIRNDEVIYKFETTMGTKG